MRLIGLAIILAVSLTVAPFAVEAQRLAGMPRIVVLSLSSPVDQVRAFEEGLRAVGHTPGTTITIDHRSAEGHAAKLPALARDALGLHPQVIVAVGTTAATAAQQATKDLPIVAVTGDIVAAGLVANMARPEGNVTGLSFFAVDLMLKRLVLATRSGARRRMSTRSSGAPSPPIFQSSSPPSSSWSSTSRPRRRSA
jgi:ABC-type uncharacterized transport system substrate-binding protein